VGPITRWVVRRGHFRRFIGSVLPLLINSR
jgi:hypothetical protein